MVTVPCDFSKLRILSAGIVSVSSTERWFAFRDALPSDEASADRRSGVLVVLNLRGGGPCVDSDAGRRAAEDLGPSDSAEQHQHGPHEFVGWDVKGKQGRGGTGGGPRRSEAGKGPERAWGHRQSSGTLEPPL